MAPKMGYHLMLDELDELEVEGGGGNPNKVLCTIIPQSRMH